MKVEYPGDRGFRYISFKDHDGYECSLQESSNALEDCIRFGMNDNHTQDPISGHTASPRMHLTKRQVQDLLPLLHYFAEKGELPESEEEAQKFYTEKGAVR